METTCNPFYCPWSVDSVGQLRLARLATSRPMLIKSSLIYLPGAKGEGNSQTGIILLQRTFRKSSASRDDIQLWLGMHPDKDEQAMCGNK